MQFYMNFLYLVTEMLNENKNVKIIKIEKNGMLFEFIFQ